MGDAWFEKSFREDYLLVYQHRDEASADQEIHNLLERLPIKSKGRVLDLCCGSGRHSRAIAKRGYEVVGVDLSSVLLEQAELLNDQKQVTYYQYDMRDIPFESEFDIVVNLFTSFGYFSDDQESAKVIKNMAKALRSGGEVVIDYLNPSYVKAHLVPESEREANGLLITERRRIEDGFVKKEITIHDVEAREPRIYQEQVRLFELEQMMGMLEDAGFIQIQVFGDYAFKPYDKGSSPRMIFHAVKK
ncbi:SAM-dependent methyltransferase [Brevibacillus laterosporus]|uniref:class I SAM-dependent methyltransferase n=1 Tax=Brevibacillus laterosporus TaxID=1465 RepID=UPI000BCE3F40|nr:class I SAM-dependent methyltransferase [Brevibacillus laterosporus]PCN43903.1 SAM-dependent methyltransferase [Brevibacillus laterosporus]